MEIRFSEKKIKESEYLEDAGIVMDYGENNHIVALEILSFSQRKSKDDLLEAAAI